jgi:hypothetical protein
MLRVWYHASTVYLRALTVYSSTAGQADLASYGFLSLGSACGAIIKQG